MNRVGIIITGDPGSGSTTLGKRLAAKLGWPMPYYAGGIVRWLTLVIENKGLEFALKTSAGQIIKVIEAGKVPLQPQIAQGYQNFPAELDRLIDKIQTQLLEDKDFGVHEGRIAWYFAKQLQSGGKAKDKKFISLCCRVAPEVGALRQLKRKENQDKTLEQVVAETALRVGWERDRYKTLYGLDNYFSPNNFDIVIDVTNLNEDEVLNLAIKEIKNFYPELIYTK